MRDRAHRNAHDIDLDHVSADVPGRASKSASLHSSDAPITSGILMRKAARDGNGVAENAESAVAEASSSSGSPLPGTLQRKFEGSLGTDLSSVRVHTGGSSASAAGAVGAKAYTVGNDIHFGAGHYDPSSTAGEHLLAHEVAHTVQQRGGSSSRQYKLEVSHPGDGFEREADRAADAMVSGQRAGVTSLSGAPVSREKDEQVVQVVEFPDQQLTPSAQMREDGERAVTEFHRKHPQQSPGTTTRCDVEAAERHINYIEAAAGPLGQLQGREDAINNKSRTVKAQQAFVPFGSGARALAHNKAVGSQLHDFKKSASRQDFHHSMFMPAYKQLGDDFLKLKATVEVIKSLDLKIVGDDAKSDIEDAKGGNHLLATEILGLKTAITDLKNTAGNAESGVAACAEKAGSSFDHLMTATEELKLPLPKLEDTEEQKKAQAGVAKVNADLEAAKTTISTIKTVVTAAISVATGGLGAAAIPQVDNVLTSIGDTTTKFVEAFNAKGAVEPAKAGAGAAQEAIEGKLATWITNYNSRIASANGKVKALNDQIKHKVQSIKVDNVTNHQSQLTKEIGRFAKLMKQVEEKKKAVTDAAKKVQEKAKKAGKKGTDIGAAAQAMATVTNFLVQCDTAESLGQKEKDQGDKAQKTLKGTVGGYIDAHKPGVFGGPAQLQETYKGDGTTAHYFECKVAPDADKRGDEDFSGYDIQENKIVFVINENDVGDRSKTMNDDTTGALERIAKYKLEAKGFEAKLSSALGIGESKIK